MRASALVVLAACGASALVPGAPRPLPDAHQVTLDTTPKERRRMVPPEVYLRAYLGWFGGLAPIDVQNRARPKGLFDAWDDYLAALGLPDYKLDLPRQGQTNTLMLATLGRLGEALCVRAAEHDFHCKTTLADPRRVRVRARAVAVARRVPPALRGPPPHVPRLPAAARPGGPRREVLRRSSARSRRITRRRRR